MWPWKRKPETAPSEAASMAVLSSHAQLQRAKDRHAEISQVAASLRVSNDINHYAQGVAAVLSGNAKGVK